MQTGEEDMERAKLAQTPPSTLKNPRRPPSVPGLQGTADRRLPAPRHQEAAEKPHLSCQLARSVCPREVEEH